MRRMVSYWTGVVWYMSFASSSLYLNYLICHEFEALLTTQTRPDDQFCAALSVFRGLGRLRRHVIHIYSTLSLGH